MSKWILSLIALLVAISTAFVILTITDVISQEAVWDYAGTVSWLAPHVETYNIGKGNEEWRHEQQDLIDQAWLEIEQAKRGIFVEQDLLSSKRTSLTKQEEELFIQKEGNKKIQHLASLYSEMKPEEAVNILKIMDLDLILKIILAMDTGTASLILAGLPPEIAASLSEQFQ